QNLLLMREGALFGMRHRENTAVWGERWNPTHPTHSNLADRVDRGLDLIAQRCGNRGAARRLLSRALPLFADDVAEVLLDELSVCRILVGLATDEVAHENDRIDALFGR